MTAKPACSSGPSSLSTPPGNAADSTTPAEEATPACADADGWTRIEDDTIERDGYRIRKSHLRRLLADPTPMYHCYAPGGVFIGAAGRDVQAAKDLCDHHRKNRP